ncbi:hypothetical protein HPB49_024819 [Dermacentor silvarum]|uniref:Uncharacterized protein n=1 Tax=Dermacentor silvarum TaxID=543639 RepID=A0ACB8CID8_DERSI|nr:hypothetical protein HPB49_024819 [Dermacentor silvarum]
MLLDETQVRPLLDCLDTAELTLVDDAVIALLKQRGRAVLESPTFLDSRESTVHVVLQAVASVPESLVITWLHRWAREKCQRSVIEGGTPQTVRDVMRPFLGKVRFLALTAKEYVDGPGSRRLFDESEGYAILSNIVSRGSTPLPDWVCRDDSARSPFRHLYGYAPL